MEQLLIHLAVAIDSHDTTLSQQLFWILHTLAPSDGNSNQRLTSSFFNALLVRSNPSYLHPPPLPLPPLSPVSLASFIDLTPWHRFGFSIANSTIIDTTVSFPILHIIDLSTTHSMQIPTLIDSLSSLRPNHPSLLRLTTIVPTSPPLPHLSLLATPLHELSSRLTNFARFHNIIMEFNSIHSNPTDGFLSLIHYLKLQQLLTNPLSEALVINCHMLLHYTPDEGTLNVPSPRTSFLKSLRALEPAIVIIVDEDANLVDAGVVNRLRAAFNYFWIPFDALDTFMAPEKQRFEAMVGWKIENVIAEEGLERVERLEKRSKWAERMRGVGFKGLGFSEKAFMEVKSKLDEYSAGWGVKRSEEELVLTWKGHDAVFASAWVPSRDHSIIL